MMRILWACKAPVLPGGLHVRRLGQATAIFQHLWFASDTFCCSSRKGRLPTRLRRGPVAFRLPRPFRRTFNEV